MGSYALVFRSHQLPPQSVTIAAIKLPGFKVLPDGTIAELRDGAEIAVRFSEAQRRVVLVSGETYFQVTKNPARPFIVVAGEVEVRAVGTAFSVQRGQSEVKVLVTEGNVVVDVAAKSPTSTNSAGLQQVLVRAGGGAIVQVSRQGEEAQIRPLANVDLRSNLAWRSPKLEFNGTPLAEVVALLNRHSRVQFVIDDPELARRKISGTFGEENTDAFLWFLETSFNIQPEGTGENVVALRSKR